MKTTKKNIVAFVKGQLSTNPAWALKALARIYTENQTATEKTIERTTEDNGIGFTGTDGEFLSSLAKQFIARGSLSDKQMVHVMKKMSKYARQVIAFSDPIKLKEMVEKA
jgi:hypothetical protein